MTDLPFPVSGLEPHEEQRFTALEQTVQRGLSDFRQTGQALAEIRDQALYRETHASFEAYLAERWGFSPRQAGQLMDAAQVARVLEPLGVQPLHEAQARRFKPAARLVEELEPEQRRLISRLVEERRDHEEDLAPWEERAAPEVKIMASVVGKMTPDTTVFHPESGDEVPFGELAPAQRYTVLREHVTQKAQQYHEKQAARAQNPAVRLGWADWFMSYAAEHLASEQQLELVIEQGAGGQPHAVARVMNRETGEIVAQGEPAGDLKKAVLALRATVG